jgi:hypothetical protein
MVLVPVPDRYGRAVDPINLEVPQPQTKSGDVDQGVGSGELVEADLLPRGAVDLGLGLGEPLEDPQDKRFQLEIQPAGVDQTEKVASHVRNRFKSKMASLRSP